MTDRFDTPTGAAYPPHDAVDDAPPTSTDLDDLIARLRAAHDAGTTINELRTRLGPLLTRATTEQTSLSQPSCDEPSVPFPQPSKYPEMPRKPASLGCDSSVWVTAVSHERSIRSLFRRGSIYQFHVRISANLRPPMGCSHMKRSLRADSLDLALQLCRMMTSDMAASFERMRQNLGMRFEHRLLGTNCRGWGSLLAKLSDDLPPGARGFRSI